jgi:hypothetical protein
MVSLLLVLLLAVPDQAPVVGVAAWYSSLNQARGQRITMTGHWAPPALCATCCAGWFGCSSACWSEWMQSAVVVAAAAAAAVVVMFSMHQACQHGRTSHKALILPQGSHKAAVC